MATHSTSTSAHCAGTGAATDTDGCLADSLPLGTRVRFAEGGNLASEGTTLGEGTLAYSSWDTMDRIGTTDANTCAYNDFALVKVDADGCPPSALSRSADSSSAGIRSSAARTPTTTSSTPAPIATSTAGDDHGDRGGPGGTGPCG